MGKTEKDKGMKKSVFSGKLFCRSKTALKYKLYLKRKKSVKLILIIYSIDPKYFNM